MKLSRRRRRAIARKASRASKALLLERRESDPTFSFGRKPGDKGRCSYCGTYGHYRTTCKLLRANLGPVLARMLDGKMAKEIP